MAKIKSTKKALLASALSLLLCVSMLVGTTFAWFTDSVVSKGNIIKSGKLDIEMMWADGKEDPTAANWKDASEGAIFDYDKWEPGYAEVRHLKISNEGTLALNYKLSIGAIGEVSKLADVIDVYYCDPAQQIADRTVLTNVNPMSNLTDALEGLATTGYGTLKADEEIIVTIALKMRESAGNEYQDLSIGASFAIRLLATQLTYEEDSFDDQYDADAKEAGVKVEKDGIVLWYTDDDEVILYDVSAFEGDKLVIPEGVTSVGYGTLSSTGGNGKQVFAGNPDIKEVVFPSTVRTIGYQAFKDSAVEKVVLNEGLTKIDDFAFNGAKKLADYNIPSTVKTIGKRAFRSTAKTELVIPANVTSIDESFRDMPNLTTVTIEGDVAIANFSFRDCPSLRTVNLLGENVTLGGGTTFCNASTNNPGVNNITFNVANEVVASRVKAAMGAGTNFYIYVNGQQVTVVSVANATQLQNALNNAVDGTIINLTADITAAEAIIAEQSNTEAIDVIVDGNGHKFDGQIKIKGFSTNAHNDTLAIKNINFETAVKDRDFIWSADSSNGSMWRYAHNVTIENCTFTASGEAVHTAVGARFQQAYNIKVIGCTATNMHSLLQAESCGSTVTVEGAKIVNGKNGVSFNNTLNAVIKNSEIASVIDGGYGVRHKGQQDNYSLTIEDCKISAFVPVLVRNMTASTGYKATLSGDNTLTATNGFGYQVVLCAGDWDNDAAKPAAPTGNYTLVGADGLSVFEG